MPDNQTVHAAVSWRDLRPFAAIMAVAMGRRNARMYGEIGDSAVPGFFRSPVTT